MNTQQINEPSDRTTTPRQALRPGQTPLLTPVACVRPNIKGTPPWVTPHLIDVPKTSGDPQEAWLYVTVPGPGPICHLDRALLAGVTGR